MVVVCACRTAALRSCPATRAAEPVQRFAWRSLCSFGSSSSAPGDGLLQHLGLGAHLVEHGALWSGAGRRRSKVSGASGGRQLHARQAVPVARVCRTARAAGRRAQQCKPGEGARWVAACQSSCSVSSLQATLHCKTRAMLRASRQRSAGPTAIRAACSTPPRRVHQRPLPAAPSRAGPPGRHTRCTRPSGPGH